MQGVQELVQIYMGMRAQGIDAKRALEILRPQISALPQADQTELVRQVRQVEAQNEEQKKADSKPVIKPISGKLPKVEPPKPAQNPLRTLPISPASYLPTTGADVVQCQHCGYDNRVGEIICTQCGQLMAQNNSPVTTQRLTDAPNTRDAFFGTESILVLTVRGSNIAFKVRPQKQSHDVVIGRSDQSVKADVDLTEFGAAGLGVSRMHVSVHYDAKSSTLSVSDMNTVNGTYLNGVKLLPQEVRVLRHGDELRLGQLVLTVHFYFAEA